MVESTKPTIDKKPRENFDTLNFENDPEIRKALLHGNFFNQI